MNRIKIAVAGLAGLAAIGAAVWALTPSPLSVDLVTVATAPMEVTVAAEGVTRVRETWAVTAPISGTVARSPVRVGDTVVKGETEVAQIRPATPALLDARSRLQAEAAVTEAQAAVRLAEVVLAQAEADADYANAQLERNTTLAHRGTIPQRALEDSQQAARAAGAALESARFDLDLHRATLARMEAELALPDAVMPDREGEPCCVVIRAPHSGTVLELADMNARPVQAGTPLLTIADLADLQVEAEFLSTDAVRVSEGASARIERWGGEGTLDAKVARIDPTGTTRVSALGIEEQRVRVQLDLTSPADARPGLGDRYRVFVRIVVWDSPAILQVPQSALFRLNGSWAVFREVEGRAVATEVTIGQRNETDAEVMSGVAEGDRVVAYPGNRITDGSRIAARSLP